MSREVRKEIQIPTGESRLVISIINLITYSLNIAMPPMSSRQDFKNKNLGTL